MSMFFYAVPMFVLAKDNMVHLLAMNCNFQYVKCAIVFECGYVSLLCPASVCVKHSYVYHLHSP